jgi:hypothetical protein
MCTTISLMQFLPNYKYLSMLLYQSFNQCFQFISLQNSEKYLFFVQESCDTARKGLRKKDSYVLPDSNFRTAMAGQPGQHSKERTRPPQNSHLRIAIIGQL